MPASTGARFAGHFRLFVALRYLKARRKQAFTSVVSTVSVLGVIVGVAALVIALALLTGFQEDIQNKIVGANGHVFVQSYGASLDDPAALVETVRAVAGVVDAAPALDVTGLLEGGATAPAFVRIKGVDTAGEARTTRILDRIIDGSAQGLAGGNATGYPGILIGVDLATTIFARVGDPVKALVHAPGMVSPMGSAANVKFQFFEVVGIFEVGMYEYDNGWALIDLGVAQRLTDAGNTASVIQVKVADAFDTGPVVAGIRTALEDRYFVQDWVQMNQAYFAALQLEKLALFVTISLIVGVAALNIVATLVLMIKDKQRDIGILMSLGTPRRDIMHIFMIQGLVIGLVGTLIGCGLGVATAYVLDTYELIRLEAQVYYLSFVPFHVRAVDFARVFVLSVLVSFAATLYPARRAARLDPVVSLRYE